MTFRQRVLVLILATSVHALAAGNAFAQSTPPTTPAAVPRPGTDDTKIAVVLVLFGALVLVLLYAYLNAWRKDTTALTTKVLTTLNTLPDWEHVQGAVSVRTDGIAAAGPAEKVVVVGPPVAVVGRPETYRVVLGGTPLPATWQVSEGSATLSAATGTETTLTATETGQVTLEAVTGSGTARAVVGVVAAPTVAPRGRLPLVGAGYGGITVGLAAITLAAALTAIDKLPDAALATLLGTVVSYFFAQRTGSGGTSGDAQTTPSTDDGT